MKRMKVWVILITLMLAGCGDQQSNNAAVSDTTTAEANTAVAKPTESGPVTLSTACESLETDKVASIMGWDAGITVAEEQLNMRNGRLTVCSFSEQGGEVFVLVRVSHESDKAQENRVLEKGYQSMLTNVDEKLTYEKIPTIIGTESIFGEGEGNHGYRVYILRNRFDNAIDTTIETSVNQGDAATWKNQLKAIAAAMN